MPVNYGGCWGETLKEAKAKWRIRREAERQADKASVKTHQPKVVRVEENGKGIVVEFTRDNRERVVAGYVLNGWERPPKDVLAATMEAIPGVNVHPL